MQIFNKSMKKKSSNTKAEQNKIKYHEQLRKLRQSEPDFMQIYDYWVELGFPAHKPDTKTFKEALKVFRKIQANEFFCNLDGMDQYNRPYSVAEIKRVFDNFKLAFDPEYEPLHKGWIENRRTLSRFFFDVTLSNKSLFIQFMREPKKIGNLKNDPKTEYKEKYNIEYEEMPDWLIPLYNEFFSTGKFDESSLEVGVKSKAFYFTWFCYYKENIVDSVSGLPFGWSDWNILCDMWIDWIGLDVNEYLDFENGRDEVPYNMLCDVIHDIYNKVAEMNREEKVVLSRGHLFSDKIWDMVLGEKRGE